MFENGPADVFERGRQSDRHLLTRGLYLQERRKSPISRKRDYQVEIAILFYFILGEAGGKAAMNSGRTRCLINTFPVLRGQIQIAKRMSQGLCMPSFPGGFPSATCQLQPSSRRELLQPPPQQGVASSLFMNASLQPVSFKKENGTFSLEALGDAPKPPL
ncbi:hypothetical protein E2320_006199 [Naja naja]|nr:hypothetical protein E2320_006199 [Naja naja]